MSKTVIIIFACCHACMHGRWMLLDVVTEDIKKRRRRQKKNIKHHPSLCTWYRYCGWWYSGPLRDNYIQKSTTSSAVSVVKLETSYQDARKSTEVFKKHDHGDIEHFDL